MFLLVEGDDPRRPQARHHSLEAILLIAILAIICGADNGTEVEFFGLQKQAWRETFLDLPHGIPSHDTFGRVFGLLNPPPLEACFAAWVQSLAATLQEGIVAVDGKATRGSHDQDRRVSPLHLVSVWADEARLVLGQRRVDDRSNELTAIPARLEMLALEGCIVTMDRASSGWGCQKRIAQTIRDRGTDSVLALKGNQPQLHEAVVETFAVGQARGLRGSRPRLPQDRRQKPRKNRNELLGTRHTGVPPVWRPRRDLVRRRKG